jgi:tetratricopeptide (TPR) repeat protein
MWPEEAEWHVWASQLADRQGQAEQVILHWDQALKLVTRRTPYAIPAGRDYLTYRQEQKAIRILEEAAHDDPGNSEILYLLGSAFDQAGQLTRALSCAEKAAELNSNVAAPALLCGDLSLRMGNLDAALAWGQKAVTLDGRSLDAVLFLAYVFEKRKNPQDALLVVHQALQRNLVSLELLLERARLVFILNGGGAALPLLKELKVTYPQQVMVLKLLAQAQMEVGDFVQAEQTAFQALRLDPEQPALNLLMGKLLRASGQLDQAIHYLSETIRQSPTSSEAFLELGQAYMDRREYKLALNIYQKAMKSIPQDFRPFYQAGLILRENKDYLGAEAMLRRAAELAPEDLNIRRQLGAVITLNLIHSSQEASSR